jgi:hypothetical protein
MTKPVDTSPRQGPITQVEERVGVVVTLTEDAAEAMDPAAATKVETVKLKAILTAIANPTPGLHRSLRDLERTRGGGGSFFDIGPKAKKINDHSQPGALASAATSGQDTVNNDNDNTLTNSFSVPAPPHPPSAFKTDNPTFAALMAKRWARPEEVVYVFSSKTEQLELTETHYKEIM